MTGYDIVSCGCLTAILCAAAYGDVKERKIKNSLNLAGVCCALLMAAVHPGRTVLFSVCGVLAAFAAGYFCWRIKAIRAGDAKLFCVVGGFFGWQLFFSCFLEAVLLGAIGGLPLVLYRRFVKKEAGQTQLPFAVVIAAAALLSMAYGCIWEWELFS